MAIYIDAVQTVSDAVVEPVSRTDAKNWMRISYDTDDAMIDELISASRQHLEFLTGLSFTGKKLKSYISLTGEVPHVWMVDLPYGPLFCITTVKYKSGMNSWDTLTLNEDYENIGGKLWFYEQGTYEIVYEAGFGDLPAGLENDILTLVAWMYQNRGKKMNADPKEVMSRFPNWDGLNYHQYKKIVI